MAKAQGKAKGGKVIEEVEETETGKGGNVIDLMAALKKSVDTQKGGKKKSSGGRKKKSA